MDLQSLRPALAELERYIEWVNQTWSLGLQSKTLVVIQTKGKSTRLGHFASKRWSTKEGEAVHEISLSAEDCQRTTLGLLETMHHETVHLACEERGIKDCSKSGRHNKRFKEAAEGLDLQVLEPTKSKGFAFTELTERLVQQITKEFQPDEAAFRLFRVVIPPKPGKTKMKKWCCACEPVVNLRAAVEIHVTCDDCEQPFVLQEG